ncbi:MAG TPA: hypothetical protein DCP58_06470 [Verrucomicrobiales bacterium]|jgi:hypothetical protein|nr:hypothetical protein [Verrucomicrobiales bacterium]
MTSRQFTLPLLGFILLWSQPIRSADSLPDGQDLARSIRDAIPTESASLEATMEVTLRDRKRIKTPLTIQTKPLGQADCLMTYETKPSEGNGEYWIVRRILAKRNEYRVDKEAKRLAKREDFEIGLARSSFTLSDLGLEFLHWPKQKTIRKQRRKSRSCHVLESSRSDSEGTLRVLSWVDIKSGGILAADFYSADGKVRKRFSVKGLTKKDGHWQVDEMEMRDVAERTRSRLRLHFK